MFFLCSKTKGPFWEVETGRRDGKISLIGDPINPVSGLPPFFLNITALKQSFALRGLSVKDLVVLSGLNVKYITISLQHYHVTTGIFVSYSFCLKRNVLSTFIYSA